MNKNDRLLSVFFPNRCCGCGTVLHSDEELCDGCKKLRAHFSYGRGFCKVCGQKNAECICDGRQFFGKSVFSFFYAGTVKSVLQKFKFHGKLFYGRLFARQMMNAAEESGILNGASLIVPVPMHPIKKLKRGFNQTELLAKELSRLSGIPSLNVLEVLNFSSTQHELGSLERAGNVAGAFEVKRKNAPRVDGARIILIDDIMTTHATLNEAAKTLLVFGADSVDALTVAATRNSAATARKTKKPGQSSPPETTEAKP